jgi:hypothetical protein
MRSFLLITGILASIGMFFPSLVLLGYFLLIIPGVILTCAPSVFAYGVAVSAIEKVFKLVRVPFPFLVSVVAALGAGSLIAIILNLPMWQKIDEIKNNDIPLQHEIVFPQTIAIFVDEFKGHFQEADEILCNSLCQYLLYNKAAEKVIIGFDYNQTQKNDVFTSYSIEPGKNCKQIGYISNQKEDLAIKNVQMRMAFGECLLKSETPLSEAQLIFLKHKDSQNSKYQNYWDLRRNVIFINKIELLKKNNGSYDPIYRFTKIEAQPFMVPLSFGTILGAGGGSLSADTGFFHYNQTVNTTGVNYYNFYEDFKPQLAHVFGNALKPIEAVSNDAARKLLEKIFGSEDYDADEKQRYFDWYLNFLTDYNYQKKVEIKSVDIELLKKGITDPDIGGFWSFSHVIHSQGEDKFLNLIPYIFNRILISESRETVRSLSSALAAFSADHVSQYREQIENGSLDPEKIEWITVHNGT